VLRNVVERSRTFERFVGAVIAMRPLLAVTRDPEREATVSVHELAEAIGAHESRVAPLARVCRFQTQHHVIGFTGERWLGFRAL
jgi:hypothetical protein